MATSPRRSLVSRAGAAARKVVRRTGEEEGSAPTKAAKKAAATKTPATKAAATKAAAKKAPAKKTAAKKTAATTKAMTAKPAAAKKAPTKKTGAKKTAATTKATTGKPAGAKPAAKKAATTEPAAKKTAAKKTAAKKTATKAPAAKSAAAVKTGGAKKSPAKKTAVAQAPATKAAAKKAAPAKATRGARAGSLVVLEQEEPWTAAELDEVRGQLHADIERLGAELAVAEQDLAGLMREGSDGAGNDQADVGTATFERDQEMTVVHNARDMLEQSQHALERIADGSYGVCENCGNPIGKNRLMAFPRATLCMTCKQREERR